MTEAHGHKLYFMNMNLARVQDPTTWQNPVLLGQTGPSMSSQCDPQYIYYFKAFLKNGLTNLLFFLSQKTFMSFWFGSDSRPIVSFIE